jgi:hypothetical protein
MPQQPSTSNCVVSETLETGTVNVLMWRSLRQRRGLLHSRLQAVYGVWQREDETANFAHRRAAESSISARSGRPSVERSDCFRVTMTDPVSLMGTRRFNLR